MMNGASAVDLAALRGAIARPIEESEAEIGVALRHVESGMEVLIDADARYPMASVFKIPILVEALARVGEGRQALDTRVGLRAEDRVPPLGVLVTLEPGLRPTLKDLLMLMIVQSDNMATDAVLGLIGLESVERRMRALGLPTISVKMSVRGLFAATFEPVDPSLPPAEEARAVERQGPFWDAPTNRRTPENNVCSPRDMALLLERRSQRGAQFLRLGPPGGWPARPALRSPPRHRWPPARRRPRSRRLARLDGGRPRCADPARPRHTAAPRPRSDPSRPRRPRSLDRRTRRRRRPARPVDPLSGPLDCLARPPPSAAPPRPALSWVGVHGDGGAGRMGVVV